VRPDRKPLPPRVQDRSRQPAPAAPTERQPLPTDPLALPPLPDAFHDTLAAGLTALDLTLGPGQLTALDHYVRLLLAWTEAINLTAIREPAAVAREHLLDSLAAVALLRGAGAGAGRVLDLGSGGGLPGLPLAIALPESRVLLVESVGKKALFLRTAVDALGLVDRVAVAQDRAEALAAGTERTASDVVTVRAVAALPELVELAFPLLRVGGRLIAWKRGDLDAELADGRRAVGAIGGGTVEAIPVPIPGLGDHRLVVVTKRTATARRFPRPPAERRARPL
jgi:16S rRNA (guanine527-N7)-methyltransferase